MKSTKMVLGIALIALGFTSCKDEKAVEAEKSVDTYVMYVDSLGNVTEDEARANWEGIETTYQLRSEEAQAALANMKDNAEAQARLEAATAKYEAMKAKYQAEVKENAAAAVSTGVKSKQQLRNALFGEGKIGEDMSFNWVNKDNILGVYQNFVNTVDTNKDAYSREDWDEVKLMY